MNTDPTIPCRYCEEPTRMLGTKLCDGCWELAKRVRFADPLLIAKILQAECSPETVRTVRNCLLIVSPVMKPGEACVCGDYPGGLCNGCNRSKAEALARAKRHT